MTITTVLRDSLIVSAACTVLALAVNAARSDGIPVVAEGKHEVLVPCPAEELGPARPVEVGDPALSAEGTLLIDAREAEEFSAWHAGGAINVYYDLLEETPEYRETIRELLQTHRTAKRVIVYGDDEAGRTTADGRPGDEAGTGFLLAGALSGQGFKNVLYVVGGAAALREGAGR